MSVKAWNDEQEAELIKLYTEEGIKDVYELADHFSQGYRITDTYRNRSRIQSLLRYSFETKKIEVIGEFFSGMEFIEERRCDLHPRISYGNRIFFDSSFSGRRRFYSLDL